MPTPAIPLELLLNLGFAITALGYLVRDILWLRTLAIVAYSLFCLVALQRGGGPVATFLSWYAVFITINVGHAAWLIYERRLVRLSDEECRLRDRVFPTLDPQAVKRLMRAGTWLDLPPGEVMTREGRPPKHVYVITAGEATVSGGAGEITRLGPGSFVGEIAFLRAGAATASTVACPEARAPAMRLRCLAWEQERLRRRLARDERMRTVMYAAIGADLASKIAADNVRGGEARTGAAA